MAYNIDSIRKKEWQIYADQLTIEAANTPREVKRMVVERYPRIDPSTVYYYITHVSSELRNRSLGSETNIGYSCPACGYKTSKITSLEYHGDHSYRTHKCKCGYLWKTIEIDLDMFERMTGGSSYENR